VVTHATGKPEGSEGQSAGVKQLVEQNRAETPGVTVVLAATHTVPERQKSPELQRS
jgi:3-deoxy-D-manno-octulosonic acid (KDO) 8-phosphate synthase